MWHWIEWEKKCYMPAGYTFNKILFGFCYTDIQMIRTRACIKQLTALNTLANQRIDAYIYTSAVNIYSIRINVLASIFKPMCECATQQSTVLCIFILCIYIQSNIYLYSVSWISCVIQTNEARDKMLLWKKIMRTYRTHIQEIWFFFKKMAHRHLNDSLVKHLTAVNGL